MIYELINPSDCYTLEAEDRAAAASVCLFLGGGMYGLTPQDSDAPDVPCMFGWQEADLDSWWTEQFGGTLAKYLKEHAADIAAVADSVMIGRFDDRDTYFQALRLISTEEGRKEWRDTWLDRRRSSLNNIGARAFALAEDFRRRAEVPA